MALNDVKEITIPEGPVKQIQDSNGNIIWGSQSAFPYRRLEYIHFNGAEYINTNKTLTGPNTYKRATMKVSFQDVNRWSYCGYIGNNSNFVFGTRPTNLATFSLGAASYGANAYALSTNTIYQYDLWVNNANNNSLTVSDESGTALWTSNALSATWSANTGNLYIGACYDARSSRPSSYMIANIYSFIVRQPSYGVIVYNGIPCQRKSDGVCGMYDTITGTFRAMEGTAITDAAAGPLVDEYWNLQA